MASKMMKAMRLFNQQKAELFPLKEVSIPIPEPGRNQVRLKVKTCGVCHTDLHTVEGDIVPPRLPITPGHQIVGIIDKLGPSVSSESLSIGKRVGVPWLHSSCSQCARCSSGTENLCEEAKFTGFHHDGGFAAYTLAQEDFLVSLPDSMSDLHAAPLLCAGIIGYRSIRLAEVEKGSNVGLYGFGASAHLSLQVLRHWGCRVWVFTRSEAHRQHAKSLGAFWTGGADDQIGEIDLDSSVIFAPAGDLVPVALQHLRPGGTLAINAIHMSDIPSIPYGTIYRERTLRTVCNSTRQDAIDFIELASEIPIKPTVAPYQDLTSVGQALIDVKKSAINGEAVICIS